MAFEYIISQQQRRRKANPFYIRSFDFYQIIYDDELVKNVAGNSTIKMQDGEILGRCLIPEVAGIIKCTKGLCTRWGNAPYEKDWTTEKEVRLKVGIQQYDIFENGELYHDEMILRGVFYPKISVPMSENAFKQIRIKFSPKFVGKDKFIEKIKELMPESEIEIIK